MPISTKALEGFRRARTASHSGSSTTLARDALILHTSKDSNSDTIRTSARFADLQSFLQMAFTTHYKSPKDPDSHGQYIPSEWDLGLHVSNSNRRFSQPISANGVSHEGPYPKVPFNEESCRDLIDIATETLRGELDEGSYTGEGKRDIEEAVEMLLRFRNDGRSLKAFLIAAEKGVEGV